MQIERVYPVSSHIVEVSGNEFSTYERCSADNWQVLMGESWEPVFFCEELEAAYQAYIKSYIAPDTVC